MKLQQSDWDILFPSNSFSIGTIILKLTPVPLNLLPLLAKHFKTIKESLSSRDITVDNYRGRIDELVLVILDGAPGLIGVMSGLDPEDVVKLPVGVATSLLISCIDINTRDQDSFLKNLLALANKVGTLTATTTAILGK